MGGKGESRKRNHSGLKTAARRENSFDKRAISSQGQTILKESATTKVTQTLFTKKESYDKERASSEATKIKVDNVTNP